MSELAILFPEITTEAWLRKREAAWAIAEVECELKNNHRKKALNKIKNYFFTGELGDDNPIEGEIGTQLMFFPVISKEGYDWFYRAHSFTEELLLNFSYQSAIDNSYIGFTDKQQLIHWDYHLGSVFQESVSRETKDGVINFKMDPVTSIGNIVGRIDHYVAKGSYSLFPKWIERVSYLYSAIEQAGQGWCDDIFLSNFRYIFEDLQKIRKGEVQKDNPFLLEFANSFFIDFPRSEAVDSNLKDLFEQYLL